MRHVYGNATLTIAAAAATNVHKGIFRQPTADPRPENKIPYNLSDGTIGTAFVEFEDIKKGGSRISEPLNTRGWTFQEQILSPRVVVFYKDQLSWGCTSTLINSNGPLNPLVNQNQDSPGRYSDYIASRALVDTESDLSKRVKYMAYWRTLIEFYSRRTISNTNDKLKAIAGLGQLIKSKTNDSYVAGVWRSDIWTQLLWYTEDPSAKRQLEYRAPTWSWASIDGQVKFWNEKSPVNVGRIYDYVEIDMELDPSEDEFGEILQARLRIRGHLHCWDRGLRSAQKAANEHEKNSHHLIDPLKWFGIFIDEVSDEEDLLSADNDLSYYFFYPSQPLCTSSPAIILKTVDSTTYRRVGIFSEDHYSQPFLEQWLQQWNKNATEIITIE